MKKMCAKCGGSMKSGGAVTKIKKKVKTMAKGGTMYGIPYGIPQTGPTGPNYQGVDTMKKGGRVNTKKTMAKGGSFGMLSVKAGVDKNPKPTIADRIAGAKMKMKMRKKK